MSFDLYFVPRRADGDWDAAMDALEEAAENREPGDDVDLATWQRITSAVAADLPESEESVGDSSRVLTYEPIGLQLSMSAGELSISVAYWSEGEEAMRTIEKLRRIAATVERVTGLVAYDPQEGELFLEGAPDSAVASFDQARTVLDHPPVIETPPDAPRRRWSPFRRR